jgi:hypothetical protein
MILATILPLTLVSMLFPPTMMATQNIHTCPKRTTAHYIYKHPVIKECVCETNNNTNNNTLNTDKKRDNGMKWYSTRYPGIQDMDCRDVAKISILS